MRKTEIGYLKSLLCVLGIIIMVISSGCATIVKGSDQTVTVLTDPAGATCRLERDGTTIGVVNPTPGSVNIDKSKDQITIYCEKDGFEQSAGVLSSKFQGMTFGNILFGGLIGVAIDAGTGAMNEYPDSLNVILIPTSFASIEERDAFYDRIRADTKRLAADAAAKVQETCAPDAATGCARQVKAIEADRDAKFADFEMKQQRAIVVPKE